MHIERDWRVSSFRLRHTSRSKSGRDEQRRTFTLSSRMRSTGEICTIGNNCLNLHEPVSTEFRSQPRSDRSDNPQVSHNQAGSTNVIPSCRLIEHFVLTVRDNFAHKIYQTELTLFVLIGNQNEVASSWFDASFVTPSTLFRENVDSVSVDLLLHKSIRATQSDSFDIIYSSVRSG